MFCPPKGSQKKGISSWTNSKYLNKAAKKKGIGKPKNKCLNLEPLTRTKQNLLDGIFGRKQY